MDPFTFHQLMDAEKAKHANAEAEAAERAYRAEQVRWIDRGQSPFTSRSLARKKELGALRQRTRR